MINVLIADDELLMRIGLKSMINWEEQGFQIIGEAANGKEALEIAREQKPDLIITDIKMPVMDGLELIREASGFLDSCEYVILSCMDDFQYVKEALKLGAADYLIKSDIKQQQLVEVLDTIKRKVEISSRKDNMEPYKRGVNYLKETLFKEMLSGFRKEEDFVNQLQTLNIRVRQEDMMLLKLKVDHFEIIRKKYVEKDEQLLRYAVINILEEIIPRKWSKEIIVENSAEYLIVMNIHEASGGKLHKDELGRLFEKLFIAMRDFLNISFSIGVSSIVPSFKYLKAAYHEADIALKSHFYNENGKVITYEEIAADAAIDRQDFVLGREGEKAFKLALESHNYEQFSLQMEQLKNQLHANLASEQAIRKTYIRIMEWMSSHFPSMPDLVSDNRSTYERLLGQETFDDIHQWVMDYFHQSIHYKRTLSGEPKSYADLAIQIIMKHYAEEISLQTVANQINVNSSYLSRIFKQETGENFINFLTKVRIDTAKYYLESRSLKVYEVADKVGYPNTTYFSKIFKKVVGVTPDEYRG
ncbi:response regulator [Cohnella sp.]|uniref:response regulator n=1 Tax=Cohnella sp. TaxID=1883426 RepID=UPI00356A28AF